MLSTSEGKLSIRNTTYLLVSRRMQVVLVRTVFADAIKLCSFTSVFNGKGVDRLCIIE
jgi:hypothetical protein